MKSININHIFLIALIALTITAIAITGAGCGGKSEPTKIKIHAEVAEFAPQSMHEDYMDGGWATFDSVVFKIIEPEEWAGTNLTVYCQPDDTNITFKTVGDRFTFKIREDLMPKEYVDSETGHISTHNLFDGALENLKKMPRTNPTEGQR